MLSQEILMSLEDAGRLVPGGKSKTTVWRWCREGYKGIHLESLSFGRRLMTSGPAIIRFAAAINEKERQYPDGHPQADEVEWAFQQARARLWRDAEFAVEDNDIPF